jgi:GDP-mannose 6-dehydrogenase
MTSPERALAGSDIAVVATSDRQVREGLQVTPPARILDLNGHLGPEIEQLPGYEGIGWVA